jgi:hypothetical protein
MMRSDVREESIQRDTDPLIRGEDGEGFDPGRGGNSWKGRGR